MPLKLICHKNIHVVVCRKTREEQKQFQQKRAEELYVNIKRVKELGKKRAQEVSKTVEVCLITTTHCNYYSLCIS